MAEQVTLARPYAQAAFDFAVEKQQVEKWANTLSLLKTITENVETQSLLSHPELTSEQRVSFYKDVCESNLSEEGVSFVKLLAENCRLLLLPQIAVLFRTYVSNWQAKLNVNVITAMAVEDAQLAQLEKKLEQKFKRKIEIECTEDKSLLAGIILKMGDKVMDGSARGRLNRLLNDLQRAE